MSSPELPAAHLAFDVASLNNLGTKPQTLGRHKTAADCFRRAVAHLAGAVGIPTWLTLTFSPDWRWQLERSDSPWYPTMRLFRQRRFQDGTNVFADIAEALRQL